MGWFLSLFRATPTVDEKAERSHAIAIRPELTLVYGSKDFCRHARKVIQHVVTPKDLLATLKVEGRCFSVNARQVDVLNSVLGLNKTWVMAFMNDFISFLSASSNDKLSISRHFNNNVEESNSVIIDFILKNYLPEENTDISDEFTQHVRKLQHELRGHPDISVTLRRLEQAFIRGDEIGNRQLAALSGKSVVYDCFSTARRGYFSRVLQTSLIEFWSLSDRSNKEIICSKTPDSTEILSTVLYRDQPYKGRMNLDEIGKVFKPISFSVRDHIIKCNCQANFVEGAATLVSQQDGGLLSKGWWARITTWGRQKHPKRDSTPEQDIGQLLTCALQAKLMIEHAAHISPEPVSEAVLEQVAELVPEQLQQLLEPVSTAVPAQLRQLLEQVPAEGRTKLKQIAQELATKGLPLLLQERDDKAVILRAVLR